MRRQPLSLLLALAALSTTTLAQPARAADQAGVAAAVRGEVTLARAQAVGVAVASGDPIFMRDGIRSGAKSGMQILLLDETIFTIGPESEILVDEFVYDPGTNAGRLSAHVAKGVFRFVTGKIAKESPSDMKVTLPSGNIGVRGTMVAGSVDPTTRSSLVILLGEGADNAAGDPAGSIDVCNAGSCTHVERPGFAVRIDGVEAPPTPAFRVESERMDSILREIGNPGGIVQTASADDRDASVDPDPSGDPRPDDRARRTRRILRHLEEIDEASDLAAQDQVQQQLVDAGKMLPQKLPDGPTYYEQLRSIQSGVIHYQQVGTPMTSTDTYDMYVNVDFGNRTYGGGNSRFKLNGTRNVNQGIGTFSYGNLNGEANWAFQTNAIIGVGCGTNCSGTLYVDPQNANGKIAGRANHRLDVFDMGGTLIDSGGGNAPGLNGPAQ